MSQSLAHLYAYTAHLTPSHLNARKSATPAEALEKAYRTVRLTPHMLNLTLAPRR